MNTKKVALSVKNLETPKETNKTNACVRGKEIITKERISQWK